METRFNPVRLNSVQAFVSIHSRSTPTQRQVYFARTDGFCPALLTEISAADQTMQKSPQSAYCRLNRLALLLDPAKTGTLRQRYLSVDAGKNELLPQYPALSAELAAALEDLFTKLRAAQPGMPDPAVQDIAVQLLFWTEQHLLDLLTQREKKFCKLIYAGCTGIAEFLFGYLAAMLGIDTMVLMPEGAGNIPPRLLRDCAEITYGPHTHADFPEYKPKPESVRVHIPQKNTAPETRPAPAPVQTPQKQPAAQTPPPVKIKITRPDRPAPQTPPAQPAPVRVQVPASRRPVPQERSYEELAALAQSVVMIVIHNESGEPVGSGSGIAINPEGYILTNCHVVHAGRAFSVRIENDDRVYGTADIIKYHTQFDLALIRIQRELTPLPVFDGRKPLLRGEKVFAIGSPLGLFNSVSDGIISGFRTINGREMIQFTAPISHGSSGGALLNSCGELVGICTSGIDEGQNINLAVNFQHIRSFAGNFLI